MEKQEVTFDYGRSEGSHEVYLVVDTSTNTLLYIGHGAAGRHKHTYSGISHVYGLNYEHFQGTPINIRVVPFADKKDANLVEAYLIAKLQPKYNRAGLMKSLQFLKDLQKPIDELKVGNAYVPDEIKLKVHLRTGIVPKSTQEALKVLRKYYEVVPTNIKGQSGYRVVRIL